MYVVSLHNLKKTLTLKCQKLAGIKHRKGVPNLYRSLVLMYHLPWIIVVEVKSISRFHLRIERVVERIITLSVQICHHGTFREYLLLTALWSNNMEIPPYHKHIKTITFDTFTTQMLFVKEKKSKKGHVHPEICQRPKKFYLGFICSPDRVTQNMFKISQRPPGPELCHNFMTFLLVQDKVQYLPQNVWKPQYCVL